LGNSPSFAELKQAEWLPPQRLSAPETA